MAGGRSKHYRAADLQFLIPLAPSAVLDSTSSFVSNKLSLSGMSKLDLVTAYNASSAHVSAAAIAKDLPHVWKPGCNGSGFNVASTKVLLGRALTADVWNDPSWILTLAAQTNFALVFLGTLFWHVVSRLLLFEPLQHTYTLLA